VWILVNAYGKEKIHPRKRADRVVGTKDALWKVSQGKAVSSLEFVA
jgi:hypothetical protein